MQNKKYIQSWDSLFDAINACYQIEVPLGCDLIGDVTVNLTNCDKQGTYDALVACSKKYPELNQYLNLEQNVTCDNCDNKDNFTLESSFDFNQKNKAFDLESYDNRIICNECSSERCFVEQTSGD